MQKATPSGSRQQMDAPAPSPQTLMERFLTKDPSAAEELCDRFASRVFGLGMMMFRDRAQAEDLVQDTFVKLWRKGSAFDPARGSLETWVLLTARRLAIDVLRRQGLETRTLSSLGSRWDPTPPPDPEYQAEVHDLSDRVRRIMAGLSPKQRRAIELAYFDGKSSPEIAEQEGIPLGTAKSHIRLALLKLRAAMVPADQPLRTSPPPGGQSNGTHSAPEAAAPRSARGGLGRGGGAHDIRPHLARGRR